MKKVDGTIIKGKKYTRNTDFKRDDTKTLIRKATQKSNEYNEIVEILKVRREKAIKAEKKELVKEVDKFFASIR